MRKPIDQVGVEIEAHDLFILILIEWNNQQRGYIVDGFPMYVRNGEIDRWEPNEWFFLSECSAAYPQDGSSQEGSSQRSVTLY